jgi:hypothetical protein
MTHKSRQFKKNTHLGTYNVNWLRLLYFHTKVKILHSKIMVVLHFCLLCCRCDPVLKEINFKTQVRYA